MASLAELDALAARHRAANWRTWTGRGTCPVAPLTRLAVMFRNGRVSRGQAGDYCWIHDPAPDGQDPEDIVSYRVVGEAPAQEAVA